MLARQRREVRRAEALMPHFDRVANGAAIDFLRQQREKFSEVFGVELLRRHKLPVDRAELFFELRDAAGEEPCDQSPGLGQCAAIGCETRPLERETKPSGVSSYHLRKLSGFWEP